MNGWEGQRGKRVLYRSRVMHVVHADLYRMVLETVGDTPTASWSKRSIGHPSSCSPRPPQTPWGSEDAWAR